MGEGNGKVPALAVGRAMLASAPGRRKLDVIYSVSDPKAFVRSLPAEDLYFALREVGLADAADVIGLLSPLQFRTMLDFDVWDRDEPVPARILEWLALARAGAESSVSLRRQREALDRELILLVLRTQTTVHFLEEEEDPVLESNDWIQTPDGKYIVEITAPEDEARTVRWLIEDFIDAAPFEAIRLFEAVRWEMQSELEETSLRWRSGRMRDLGFPELDEAMNLWRPLPADWKPAEEPLAAGAVAGIPALLLTGRDRALFLDRVVARLPDESRATFNDGLLYLLNCAIVADRVAPRDLELARPSIESARDMLSLGLELVTDGDEDMALRVLGATPATQLFRRAAVEVAQLAREASDIVRSLPGGSAAAVLLDAPEAQLLAGLRKRRPQLFDPPAPGEKRPEGEWRAFRDRADLLRARQALARANVAAQVLARLGVVDSLEAIADASNRTPSSITLSQLVLTATARALLRLTPTAEPLDAVQVELLCDSFEAGRLKAPARALVDGLFDSIAAALEPSQRPPFDALREQWFARLESELGAPCAAGGIEARFVDAVLSRPA